MINFFFYFLKSIFRGERRQKILVLSVLGLVLSSASLFILHSVMGGLQINLINKSKKIEGVGYWDISKLSREKQLILYSELQKNAITFSPQISEEVVIKHQGFLAPINLIGIDFKYSIPSFLRDVDHSGLVLGSEIAYKLKTITASEINIFSPLSSDSLLGEIPRVLSESITEIVATGVPEMDMSSGWVRSTALQNLLKKNNWDRVTFYPENISDSEFENLSQKYQAHYELFPIAWETTHQNLYWALNLERFVMTFLFICMCVLVGISISSGYSIFFNQIRHELVSFWILGMEKKKLIQGLFFITNIITVGSVILGVVLGALGSFLLQRIAPILVPNIFVEQSLPIRITFMTFFYSFLVPIFLSFIFSLFSLRYFSKENNSYIELIRGKSD